MKIPTTSAEVPAYLASITPPVLATGTCQKCGKPARRLKYPDGQSGWVHDDYTAADTMHAVVLSAADRMDIGDCTCVFSCADDPATMCSLSGGFHVHPESGACPLHPDAPGDL